MMIGYVDLKEALNLLKKAQNNMDLQDYTNIWGKHLGNHIWRQEGSDLLRIWKSGLTQEQADKFITYIIDKYEVL